MFTKILIANRGEIACRIIKTAKRMGIETVAIYAATDRDSLYVQKSDEAYCLTNNNYLDIEAVIAIATRSHAQAIHPGYGFLSENPDMVRACERAGIIFIGPHTHALETMASKQLSKQLLAKTQVPLIPGYHGLDQSNQRLHTEATHIGFPLLLKAAFGGGGKGMHTVLAEADFSAALQQTQRESLAYFANDTIIIEKLMTDTRHIEVQIMADNFGNIVHIMDRDCSIQRRHQKIIEEAPAYNISVNLREKLTAAAKIIAATIEYRGAGTIEFLVTPDEQFYFMEMNTRLQVEHPVTEMITGLDLVEWQLRIAANEPLPLQQIDISAQGHAIECRIYAEDPSEDFIPSMGHISLLQEPTAPGIRVDSGIRLGSYIGVHFDPLVAKLIAHAETRATAISKLHTALNHYFIGGIKTNISFLRTILSSPQFMHATLNTNWLSNTNINIDEFDVQTAIILAASHDYLASLTNLSPLQKDTFGWQLHLSSEWSSNYQINNQIYLISIVPINDHEFNLKYDQQNLTIHAKWYANSLIVDNGICTLTAKVTCTKNETLTFFTSQGSITVKRWVYLPETNQALQVSGCLTAPMPATVIAILKQVGDQIQAGEGLLILEAMKMEHTILATSNGVVTELYYAVGAQVTEGSELIRIEPIPVNLGSS